MAQALHTYPHIPDNIQNPSNRIVGMAWVTHARPVTMGTVGDADGRGVGAAGWVFGSEVEERLG